MSRAAASVVRFAALEQRLTPDQAARVKAYERKVGRLVSRGARTQRQDIQRIRRAFTDFRTQALGLVPARFAMNQAAIVGLLDNVARQLDGMSRTVTGVIHGAMTEQAALAEEIARLYGDSFLPIASQAAIIGTTPQAIELAGSFSAELIGLGHGGLASRMLAEVNRVIRLAALGAGAGAFNAATEIQRAINGATSVRWSFQAERIYRTETLRVHSLVMQQSINELNSHIRTHKRWVWSGISRLEHQRINGQTVAAKRRFRVPLREGGTAALRFPRDPGAPPSATVACGCYVIPWPAGETARRRRPAPAAPRRRPRSRRRPSAGARVAAAKSRLQGFLSPGGRISKTRTVTEEAFATRLERVAAEWERVTARYPGLRNVKPQALEIFQRQGGLHVGRTVKVGEFDRLATGQTDWTKRYIQFQDFATGAPLAQPRAISVRWNTARRETTVEDIFRHELGHDIDEALGIQNMREWEELLERYPVQGRYLTPGETYEGGVSSFWGRNLTLYSTKIYRWERARGGLETWAELFARITEVEYVEGTLPRQIEDFVKRILGVDRLGGEP